MDENTHMAIETVLRTIDNKTDKNYGIFRISSITSLPIAIDHKYFYGEIYKIPLSKIPTLGIVHFGTAMSSDIGPNNDISLVLFECCELLQMHDYDIGGNYWINVFRFINFG